MPNLIKKIPWTSAAILPLYSLIGFLALYSEVVISRDLIFTHDSIHWYGMFSYFVRALTRGFVPMWDPYSISGVPYFFSQNIVGPMDPLVLLGIPLVRFFHLSVL